MSRAEAATIFVVIGARRVECVLQQAGQWRQHACFELADASMPALVHQLQACAHSCSAHLAPGKHVLRVLVADVWLAAAPVFWSESLRQPDRAQAFARGRLEALGFSLQDDDLLRLDDAPYGQPRLAVAYPAVLLGALAQLAHQLGARLNSLLPLGVAAWETLTSGDGRRALAVQDDGMLLVLHGCGHVQDLSCRRIAGDAVNERAALWRRLQLRDTQLAGMETLPVLDLAATAPDSKPLPLDSAPSPALQLAAAARGSALGAISPTRRHATPLRLAASVVILATAMLLLLAVDTVQRRSAPMVAAGPTASLPQRGAALPLTTREAARVTPVNGAVRALNQPIIKLLRALEPPAGLSVALLGLDIKDAAGARGPRMQVTALARTPADMSRYLRFLAAQTALTGVYLTGHEIVDVRPHPYRFTLEAVWVD